MSADVVRESVLFRVAVGFGVPIAGWDGPTVYFRIGNEVERTFTYRWKVQGHIVDVDPEEMDEAVRQGWLVLQQNWVEPPKVSCWERLMDDVGAEPTV